MKKFVPFVAAVMLAVSFTAFNSFRVAEKKDATYYFQSSATGSEWHEYDGDACDTPGNNDCKIPDPIVGGSGNVQLYLSPSAIPANRVLRQ
ncbi:MAG: hypothetical protein J7527_01595 [Chitinophagaceae bacterium]|nr:hypothetical protein [Chitinophagaceae bacterium]